MPKTGAVYHKVSKRSSSGFEFKVSRFNKQSGKINFATVSMVGTAVDNHMKQSTIVSIKILLMGVMV